MLYEYMNTLYAVHEYTVYCILYMYTLYTVYVYAIQVAKYPVQCQVIDRSLNSLRIFYFVLLFHFF